MRKLIFVSLLMLFLIIPLGLAVCGNGIREGTEQCDDGNLNNNDICLKNCHLASCGDGYVWLGYEVCDDGSLNGQSGKCKIDCSGVLGPVCGDGIKNGNEQCDDGNSNNNDICLTNCRLAGCGDGYVWLGYEVCDDGSLNGQPGKCKMDCSGVAGPVCGNGIREGTEQCDDGNSNNNDVCPNNCHTAVCGDGYLWLGYEVCDDGSNNGKAGYCKSDCSGTIPGTGVCGDGIKNGNEQCDDGNSNNNDVCTNNCHTATCGDGYIWLGYEVCDDGSLNGQPGKCKTDCSGTVPIQPVCGNGVIESGEQCDAGANNGKVCTPTYGSSCTYCTTQCSIRNLVGPYCGDNIVNGPERCDEGAFNGLTGHCNAQCTGYVTPQPVCGNGVVEQGETCDEGTNNGKPGHCNTNCNGYVPQQPVCGNGIVENGEVCDSDSVSCITQLGYFGMKDCKADCSGYGSCHTSEYCGNGIVEGTEVCDDNGLNGLPGKCNFFCTGYVPSNPVCGNGVIESGEECDNNGLNGVPCTANYGSSCTYCSAQCKNVNVNGPYCGDLIVNGPEVCDANSIPCLTPQGYSGVRNCNTQCTGFGVCTSTQMCGNGIKEGNEKCDEGAENGKPNHCNADCTGYTQSVCGNGVVEIGENCDEGTLNGVYGHCNVQCSGMTEAVCGNGIIEDGEKCDDGALNGYANHCNTQCTGINSLCTKNSDCGPSVFCGDAYCRGSDLYKSLKYYECVNPGSRDARCVERQEDALFERCAYGCANSMCMTPRPETLAENLYVEDIWFSKIDRFTASDQLDFGISVINQGETTFEDVKVSVLIYDLGIFYSFGNFDLKEGQEATKTRVFTLPPDIVKGKYDVRIVISTDTIKRVVHREVSIV